MTARPPVREKMPELDGVGIGPDFRFNFLRKKEGVAGKIIPCPQNNPMVELFIITLFRRQTAKAGCFGPSALPDLFWCWKRWEESPRAVWRFFPTRVIC